MSSQRTICRKTGASGFTVMELLVAAVISTLVIGAVTGALIQSLRAWRAAGVRSELHMDLERSMERMRHDLRLSSVGIGLMAFYPVDAAEYTAISFPLATPYADGLLPRDAADNIIWDTTIIYHVRPGSPDELIRSRFHPRDPNATPADLYEQLVKVVQSQTLSEVQDAVLQGETATSEIIFRNLVNLVFRPPDMRFDGYAPQYERARTINWGSIILSNGVHELTFTVERKNPASTGYKVGVDRYALSYSGSPREAEWVLPANSRPAFPYFRASISGGSMIAQDMSAYGASWSGRSQLTYTPNFVQAGPSGSRLTFYVQNDIWNDATFDSPPGKIAWRCKRTVDMSFTNQSPNIPDIVIAVDHERSWEAINAAAGSLQSVVLETHDIANVIHGSADTNGPAAILYDGDFVRFEFRAGTDHHLHVRNASFGERGVDDNFASGNIQNITFGGSVYRYIPATQTAWSDWIPYTIDREKSYLAKWQRRNIFNFQPVYPTSSGFWEGYPAHTLSYLDGSPTNVIMALETMEVLPSNAVFRSGVYDTRIDSPAYKTLSWTEVSHGVNGHIGMRVRSSDYPDMHDAVWYPSGYYLSNNANNNISWISGGRYVQYEALLSVAGNHTQLPVLRDVTIAWEAPTGIVDLVVDLARGPDYGIVTADVNGQSFIRGVEIDLEIFREGPFGMERAPGRMEVRPLNTGR